MSRWHQMKCFITAQPKWKILRLTAVAITMVFMLGQLGCRGTWSPYSKLRSEPSFDQLLELESSTAHGRGPDASPVDQIRFSDQSSVHPQVAQRRPGGRSANARHSDVARVDHRTSDSPSAAEAEFPTGDTRVARRRITDDNVSAGTSTSPDLDDEAYDESDEHSNMLQKTQVALKNRYRSEAQLGSLSVAESAPEMNSPIAAKVRVDSERHRSSSVDEAVEPNSEVVVASYSEPHPGDTPETKTPVQSAVQPAVHNRYREVQGAPEIELAAHSSFTGATSELGWQKHLELAMQQLVISRQEPRPLTSGSESSGPPSREQIRQAIIGRLLAMSLGNREQMSISVDGLQPEEQEYIKYQLTALMDAMDPDANPVSSRRWSLVMLNQRKAHEHLASLSNLEITNLCFCTQVESFGVVERFPKYQFTSDQEVLLYCELDNFVSERSKDGKGFETQLQGSYEIVDSTGRRIADQTLPMDTHICRNRRRDYFIAYRVYMPQNISPGSYALRLTIEDIKGRKFGQSEVAFQIQ